MSPRRSSRARSSQNPPPAPLHTNSSSSITTMAKENRNTRSNITNARTASPQRRESTVRSESNEDADTASRTIDNTIVPRRSRRGEVDPDDKKQSPAADEEGEEAGETLEEDVTRCICGRPEYPGPGASVKEQLPAGETVSDDVGNFFVQCDKCHVWQHGGCMGLTDESMLPEEYYCENCKPDFHKIIKGINGAKTSRYLPLTEGAISEGSSLSSAGDAPGKESSKDKSLESTKRRATMNSRGAYDEDEMLRRAIEESKEMGTLKRSRDDSEDPRHTIKRQRTGSSMSSSGSHRSHSPQPNNEDGSTRSTVNGNKHNGKLRGMVAKNSLEKEMRDKQKEALASQRAEAASKRNARSERRRAEDSPPPSPALSPPKPPALLHKPNQNGKDLTPPTKVTVNRKGGRPPARRGRLGRNQYTRDLPANGDTSDSPLRDTSRDPHVIDSPRPHTNGNGFKDGIVGESGRSSKAKTHPARMSMNEMKRRVAAILEFVGRMQNERGAGTKSSSSNGSGSSSLKGNSTPNGSSVAANLPTASLVKAVAEGLQEANAQKGKPASGSPENNVVKIELLPEKIFDIMNSGEMMDTLTSELVKWQTVYGTYGR